MLRPLLAFFVFAAIGVSMLYVEGPALWRDMQVNKASLVPARDLKVEEASCNSHWWVVSNCSIRYSAPQAQAKQSIRFTVFGTLGGERFRLLRAPDNYVTTDIGLSRLTNRIIMAFVLAAFVLGTCTLSFRSAVAAA